MTILRDLLSDFAGEIIDTTLTAISLENPNNTPIVSQAIDEEKERLLDEYIEIIRERFVG